MGNFHERDAITIHGGTPSAFALDWEDGQGAPGSTGLTLHATAPGKATASLTLTGYAKAELSNGGLAVSFGNDPADADGYMLIEGEHC